MGAGGLGDESLHCPWCPEGYSSRASRARCAARAGDLSRPGHGASNARGEAQAYAPHDAQKSTTPLKLTSATRRLCPRNFADEELGRE